MSPSILIPLCIPIACLSLLFTQLSTGFTADWFNAAWMGLVQGNSLQHHGHFTDVWVLPSHVGVTYPLFYGPRLFQILGVLNLLFADTFALRLFIVGFVLVQFIFLQRRLQKLNFDRPYSILLSSLIALTTYQLTNLYNRGAIAEFVATGLLSCAWVEGFYLHTVPDRRSRLHSYPVFFALLALVVGTHSIIAFYGCALILLTVFPVWYRRYRKTDWMPMAVLSSLFILANLPWFFVMRQFGSGITHALAMAFWPIYLPFDSLLVRFFPFPANWGQSDPSLHLDAQVSGGLIVLAVIASWQTLRNKKSDKWFLLLWPLFIFLSIASIQRITDPALLILLRPFQFGYRMTGMLNLLLVAIFLSSRSIPRSRVLLIVLSFWCAIGLFEKVARGRSGRMVSPSPLVTNELPKTFYGISDYAFNSYPAALHEAPPTLSLFEPVIAKAPSSTEWIRTNVYPHPWNQILKDGIPLSEKSYRWKGIYTDIILEDTAPHKISYRYSPPKIFILFQWVSGIALLLLVGLSLRPIVDKFRR